MLSPFSSFANSTLVFSVDSEHMALDEFGNPTPTTESLEVKAYLRADGKVGEQIHPGVDESAQMVKGYCVDPVSLPESITHLSEAIATISGQKGRLILYRQLENEMVTAVTGLPLAGVFRRQV